MDRSGATQQTLVMGIAGGTGSGKTTAVRKIIEALGPDHIALLQHDWYYRDQRHLALERRRRINYDHPDALETDLLVAHARELVAGRAIEAPTYDFERHTRAANRRHIEPAKLILIEGILVLAEPDLRALMDIKVYVDTDDDIRFIRRLQRDIRDRGRTLDSVIEQYQTSVKPMHLEFVEPSKRYADVIVPEGGLNTVAIDILVARLGALLSRA